MAVSPTFGIYRLIAELGHGGMADVFLAAATGPVGSGFTKLAVVKKLRSHLAEDPEFVSMLIEEARITARLNHPNVVQLFDAGDENGQFFLAMEFLEGQPLHRVERRVAREEVVVPRHVYYAVVSEVLAGHHYAHELSDYDGSPLAITHRDVTPHNVFVTYDGVVKVVDFGLAKASGRLFESDGGIRKGKVRYMSPEQAAGEPVDRRTDIFAAGMMLWNLATGAKFWTDRTDEAIVQALRTGDFESSAIARGFDVPPEIDRICCKALAVDRADRFATADEMRVEIEALLGRSSIEARRTLAGLVKDHFRGERAEVRRVVESASLMSAVSLGALVAAGGPRVLVAPPGPLPEPPSPSATPVAFVPQPAPAPTGRASRAIVGAALALSAVVAIAVAVSLSWQSRTHEGPPHHTTPALLNSGATQLALELHTKADPTAEPTLKTVKRSRTAAAEIGRPGASSNDDPAPAPAPAPAGAALEAPPKPARRALDAADPWGNAAPSR